MVDLRCCSCHLISRIGHASMTADTCDGRCTVLSVCGLSWVSLSVCVVHIDISRVFNSALPQQCQPADSFTGAPTICAIYTKWYIFPLPYPLLHFPAGVMPYQPRRRGLREVYKAYDTSESFLWKLFARVTCASDLQVHVTLLKVETRRLHVKSGVSWALLYFECRFNLTKQQQ